MGVHEGRLGPKTASQGMPALAGSGLDHFQAPTHLQHDLTVTQITSIAGAFLCEAQVLCTPPVQRAVPQDAWWTYRAVHWLGAYHMRCQARAGGSRHEAMQGGRL